MENDKLAPCPFCGLEIYHDDDEGCYVHPYNYKCILSKMVFEDDEIESQWNTRAAVPMEEVEKVVRKALFKEYCESRCELRIRDCGECGKDITCDYINGIVKQILSRLKGG